MRVHLCRHAHAEPGEPDELRALSAQGVAAARTLGASLARTTPAPATVVTSPLVRARQTATIVAEALGRAVEVDERLGPGATAADLRAAVAGRAEPVVAVGHQPDCSAIVEELTGKAISFPPGGSVELELEPGEAG